MVAPADTTKNSENVEANWTVVLPRGRRKWKKAQQKASQPEKELQQHTWSPPDSEVNSERESKLMQKIQTCLNKLESSKFYTQFLHQIQTPELKSCFSSVLGSDPKMNMVIYGIGSIESYEPPRLQLSLAILMKRLLEWIGDIEVFDPVLSVTETRTLESLGCSVISVNEEGRRRVLKPTMFFMPHCEAVLYHNLLETNWEVDLLRNMVLFGNSFEAYQHHNELIKDYVASDYTGRILAARSFTREFRIDPGPDEHSRAFNESSWHFFSPEKELPIV